MRNIPNKIYLQIVEDELVGVSWADERINENDIEFVIMLTDQKIELTFKRILFLTNITEIQLKSRIRTKHIAFARQLFCYDMRQQGYTFKAIAEIVNRKYPAAIHATQYIKDVEKFGTKYQKEIFNKWQKLK